jgi:hypothetical protein
MGDTPYYVRTAKRLKLRRAEINHMYREHMVLIRGINKKEMGGPRKVKGRLPSDNPAAALDILNSGDKVVGVAKFLKLSFRCFT